MATKKAKSGVRRTKSGRWYGRQTVLEATKLAWVSRQDKFGWSLGLALSNRTIWLRNLRFKTEAEVKRAMKTAVQFVALKGE